MNNINRSGLRECCGCGCCAVVCPTGAARLSLNEYGFYKASVCEELCTGCSRCASVCFQYIGMDDTPAPSRMFFGHNADPAIRYASSSGGIGTALAETALNMGYAVIGAHLDVKSMLVKHIIVTEKWETGLIRGSKYAPSYTPDAFKSIPYLKKVLVIGTPCQIAGIRAAYGQRKGLLLVDFRCSSITSQLVLEKYHAFLKSIESSNVETLNMRDKTTNWRVWGVRTTFRSGKTYYANKHRDWFCKAFRPGYAMNPACSGCIYLKNASFADIRMEDAWHFSGVLLKEDLKMGLSQIAVFTDRGEELLGLASERLRLREADNTFSSHSFPVKNYTPAFLELLRYKNKTLPEIVREYEGTLSLNKRAFIFISNQIEKTRYLHELAQRLYRILKKSPD